MSESKPHMSADELKQLLDELESSGKRPVQTDIDRTLRDILDTPAPASVFEPVQPRRPSADASADLFGNTAAASAAQPKPAGAPVRSTAVPAQKPAAPAAQPAIPEQQRRPFTTAAAPTSSLKLDDSPLVDEDFRRFFTTSVTPDALFSSTTDAGVPTQRTRSSTSFMHRVRTEQPEPVTDDEEENVPMPAPREKCGLLDWLRTVFTVGDEPDEADDAEELTADDVSPTLPQEPEQPELSAAEAGISVSAEPVEEDVREYVRPAAVQPEIVPEVGASSDTMIFEKTVVAHAEQEVPTSATAIFDPVRPDAVQAAAETAAAAQPASLFDTAAESGEPQEIAENIFSGMPKEAASAETPAESGAEPSVQPSAEEEAADFYSGGRADAEPTDEEDYTDPACQSGIAAELKAMVVSLTLRAAVLAVLAVTAVWFGLAAAVPALPQPTGLVDAKNAGLFALLVGLVSLLIGGGVSWPVLKNGLPGLWKDPTEDTFAALACVGACLQTVVLLVNAGGYEPSRQLLYAAPALLALLANAIGKRMLVRGVQKNFDRLCAARQEYAVAALVRDESLVRRLTHGLGESEPCLLVSRPAGFFSGFLSKSFAPRPGEYRAQRVCQVLTGLALLAGLLAVMFDGSFVQSLAGVLCLGCPLTQVLSTAVPVSLMNRSAEANGTVLPGPDALEDLGQANVVVAQAKDLFPAGSVLLKGLKVFGEPRIDLAILYAASLLVPNCPTLRSVFLNIIQDRTEILPEIENLKTEVGCGFEGWSGSRHLLVGNRGMMIAHGVEVPPTDYELRYTKEGRYCPVYLAVNGRLYAMFVVGYRPDADVKEMLDEIYVSGLSLLVTGDDFNLTGDKIDTIYGIPSGCIKVLGEAESRQLAAHTGYVSRCDGAMAHATSFRGFIAGIRIAANGASMEKTAGTLQTVAAVLSALLVLVLTCTGGLAALGLPAVLLYQLAWAVLILMLPLAKQY